MAKKKNKKKNKQKKNNKKNKNKQNKNNDYKNSTLKAETQELQQKTKTQSREEGSFYKKHYKALMIIPFLILVLAISQIAYQTATTGDFIYKGIDLKGGISLTINTQNSSLEEVEQALVGLPYEMHTRSISELGKLKGFIIEASGKKNNAEELKNIEEEIDSSLSKKGIIKHGDYSVRVIGPSLGASFFQQTMKAMVIAFILMGLVVFYYFRTLVPSSAVILAAASDITITVAMVNILGIRLSTAGVAAFLMLLGYSVDTDILLSTRVLKRKAGTVYERVLSALKTGMVMNLTTLAAVTAALILTQSEVIAQIMTILLIGLLADIINTWIQNAGIIRMYAEKKNLR